MRITIMGAGSTVFTKAVLGDVMLTECLRECEIALYDIDGARLNESKLIVNKLNEKYNENRAKINTYLGVENRKDALGIGGSGKVFAAISDSASGDAQMEHPSLLPW